MQAMRLPPQDMLYVAHSTQGMGGKFDPVPKDFFQGVKITNTQQIECENLVLSVLERSLENLKNVWHRKRSKLGTIGHKRGL